METITERNGTFIPLGFNVPSFLIRRSSSFFPYVSLAQKVMKRTLAVKMECYYELICAAKGNPGELFLIELRCSLNRSANLLFVSPI